MSISSGVVLDPIFLVALKLQAMRLHLLVLAVALLCSAVSAEKSTNETAARIWFEDFNTALAKQRNDAVEASWNNAVNITTENTQKMLEAELRLADFLKVKRTDMQQFDWNKFNDRNLTRLFRKSDDIGTSVANQTKQERRGMRNTHFHPFQYSRLKARLATQYNTAKVINPIDGRQISLEPDIVQILADPNQPEWIKRALWVRWRDASGKLMKQDYADFVSLGNEMIQEAGYANIAKYWQSWYEPKPDQDFETMMEKLWLEFKPFYSLLHAYVRMKLKRHFNASSASSSIFPPTGQLPAHIMGNMWAQSWANIESLTVPFPDQWTIDITKEMQTRGWNITKMVQVSEEFFASLGLGNMTEKFWAKSVIQRIPGVEMNCHASAWDFYTGIGDFRIKQCTTVTLSYLATTHHEMGHIQYFQQYEKQPVPYRGGANPGFHEAVGDTIELSVMTPEHLVKIGLLNRTIDSKEYYLNYQFLMALKKIAFIPFGYLIDRWRWRVFDGTVKPENYNAEWWKLRCDLQGVASPVMRSEADFDPGAKYHVPGNTPYIRYYISHFLQFQFYEALCKLADHTDELYKCDFYRSPKAGAAFKDMLSMGSSEHWEDALFKLTGTRVISAAPLMRYFQPLIQYLNKTLTEANEPIGWQAQCPPADWYEGGSTTLRPEQTSTKTSARPGSLGAAWISAAVAAVVAVFVVPFSRVA